VVGALEHSELVARNSHHPQTAEERLFIIRTKIESRVPDVRFLVDQMLARDHLGPSLDVDRQRIGMVGHGFGGLYLPRLILSRASRRLWRWRREARPSAEVGYCPFH
jgi:predicted dienelactone hydrolase